MATKKEQLIIQVTETGTRVVKREIEDIGTSATKAQKPVNSLGMALAALGGIAALRSAVRTMADFGQAMSTVQGVSGATADQFERLTAKARELGMMTRFTASQAGDAMVQLARAGFTADETLGSVTATLRLAQAGALDFATAAMFTVTGIRGFRLGVDQATRVTDVFTMAANRSNTNVVQLGEAMKFVAPIAAGVGVSLEETTAAIAALSDAGLQGSLAGTGLRRVISELESPSAKTKKILGGLGLTADEVIISTNGLTAVLEKLEKAGVDTGQALEIFGDRGGPAFEILSNSLPRVKQMNALLNDSAGIAKKVADIMDDNVNGALFAVTSAIEAVILSFSQVRGSNLQKALMEIAFAFRFLARHIEIVAGALSVLLIPVLHATFGIIAHHPLGLLAIALGAAVGALVSFKDEIKVMGDEVTSLGDFVKATLEKITEGYQLLASVVSPVIEEMATKTRDGTKDISLSFEGMLKGVALVFDSLVATAKGTVSAIQEAFSDIPRAIGFLFFEMLRGVLTVLQLLVNKFQLQINLLLEKVEVAVNTLSLTLGGAGTEFLGRVSAAVVALPDNPFEKTGARLGAAFAEGFKSAGTPASDLVAGIFSRAAEIGKERELAGLRQVRSGPLQGPGQGIAGGNFGLIPLEANEQLINTTQGFAALDEQVKATSETVDKSKTFWEGLGGVFGQIDMSAQALGASIGDVLSTAFDDATGAFADFAMSGFQNVEQLKGAFSSLFADLSKQILQIILKVAILQGIEQAFGGGGGGAVGGFFSGLFGGGGTGPAGNVHQAGGPVSRGVPTLVGERRPEIFVPPTSGRIMSDTSMMSPQTNVTVVNVDDPNSVPRGMNSSAGEEVIINTIVRNRDQLKRVLS